MTPKEIIQALLDGKKLTKKDFWGGYVYVYLDENMYLLRESGERSEWTWNDIISDSDWKVYEKPKDKIQQLKDTLNNAYAITPKDQYYDLFRLIIDYLERESK